MKTEIGNVSKKMFFDIKGYFELSVLETQRIDCLRNISI